MTQPPFISFAQRATPCWTGSGLTDALGGRVIVLPKALKLPTRSCIVVAIRCCNAGSLD